MWSEAGERSSEVGVIQEASRAASPLVLGHVSNPPEDQVDDIRTEDVFFSAGKVNGLEASCLLLSWAGKSTALSCCYHWSGCQGRGEGALLDGRANVRLLGGSAQSTHKSFRGHNVKGDMTGVESEDFEKEFVRAWGNFGTFTWWLRGEEAPSSLCSNNLGGALGNGQRAEGGVLYPRLLRQRSSEMAQSPRPWC